MSICLYITRLAKDVVSKTAACNIQVITSNFVDFAPFTTPQDNLNLTESPVVNYYLLWTSNNYSWNDAEDVCLKIGMHLASITLEDEYHMIRAMLAGNTHGSERTIQNNHLLLTPCKLKAILCIIYIGLRIKVSNMEQLYNAASVIRL